MSDTTDTPQEPQRCQAVSRRSGKPCSSVASDGGYCGVHSPAGRALRSRNARLRGVAGGTPSHVGCDTQEADRPQDYDSIMDVAWQSFRAGGMDAAQSRAFEAMLKAQIDSDAHERDKIRLKVGEQVVDKISFAPTKDEGPVPVPAPWEDRARAAG